MKKFLIFIITLFSIVSLFTISASADMGPKAFLDVTINNLEESDYLVGLLTSVKDFGPHSSFDPNNSENDYRYDGKEEYINLVILYNKITKKEDLYLFDIAKSYTKTTSINYHIGYYPPNTFKVIVYDKVNDKLYVSDEASTYAFASYYVCDSINTDSFTLKKDYDYSSETFNFIIRLILTFLIEILIALFFKFDKKSYIIIIITNLITQVLLNVILNASVYYDGFSLTTIVIYLLLEFGVFIVESAVYILFCNRKTNKPKEYNVGYAFLANVASFILGVILWLFT